MLLTRSVTPRAFGFRVNNVAVPETLISGATVYGGQTHVQAVQAMETATDRTEQRARPGPRLSTVFTGSWYPSRARTVKRIRNGVEKRAARTAVEPRVRPGGGFNPAKPVG